MAPQQPSIYEPRLPSFIPFPNTVVRPAQVPLERVLSEVSDLAEKRGPYRRSASYGNVSNPSSGSSNGKMSCFVYDEEVSRARTTWQRLLQLEHKASSAPLVFYRKSCQWKLAGCCSLLFSALGAMMLFMATQILEISVPYATSDQAISFTLARALAAPVYVWYDIPDMSVNYKSIIASKDPDVFSAPWSFPHTCEGAETVDEAKSRRGWDAEFQALIDSSGGAHFKPCGLMSLAMFTDRYELFSCSTGENAAVELEACVASPDRKVLLNETGIALSSDAAVYEGKVEVGEGGVLNIIDGDSGEKYPSWLQQGAMFEHYKVWMHNPASGFVRNLWATVPEGLPAGSYGIRFPQNSPMEDGWGMTGRAVVLSEKSMFGSKTSLLILGTFCCITGFVELLVTCILCLAPAREAWIQEVQIQGKPSPIVVDVTEYASALLPSSTPQHEMRIPSPACLQEQ